MKSQERAVQIQKITVPVAYPGTVSLTLEAQRVISIKFLLVKSMLCKTEWL